MAQSRHTGAKNRPRRRHQTRSPSPSYRHDWASRPGAPLHSLPYRARGPEIRRPDDRASEDIFHHRARSSEDTDDTADPMPQPQQLARPGTATPRNGKGRAVYLEIDDDDDDEEERMMTRLRSRSRPRMPSRAVSSSGDDETYELPTPPKTAPVHRSRPTSRVPSASSSRTSSTDSVVTISTLEDRKNRRSRQRMKIEAPPAAADRAESRHNLRRLRSRSRYRTDGSDSDEDPGLAKALRVRERSASQPRLRRRLASRSASRVRNRRDPYEDGEPSSSKRPHRRRYYDSDVGYSDKPMLSRAHTAPSSHVTSQSMDPSSRRSSPFLNMFVVPGFSTTPERPGKMVECVACLDDLPSTKTAKLKCGHRMCRPCLKRRFKISVKDPSQMPPRCCTADCISLKHVEDLFDIDFKKTWNRKFHEFSTRNRVYCPGKRCGRWIQPDQITRHANGRRVGKCSTCQTRVCCDCNSRWHGSGQCPPDEETNQILQQAKEEGWQRCFNCRNMVELKEGCNHMTCRCGAEFCMICGLQWKTCECPWFNYETLDPDHLSRMQIPEPLVDPERLGNRLSPGGGLRIRPGFGDELRMRRLQEQQDEELARRLQFEDSDDDYMDVPAGVADSTEPFMASDYRRRPQTVVVPHAPPPPPVAPFERANSVTDYVAGVSRARGFRATSLERRLADRFEQRPGIASPTHPPTPFGHGGIPPPPAPPRAVGPPPLSQPPLAPASAAPIPMLRRHTIDDDMYDNPRSSRYHDRSFPRRASTRGYVDDPAVYEPGSRVRRRGRSASLSPKDSVLAGLAGPGRGMHRVYEWVNHVESDPAIMT
ncbi:hypothetical protein GGS23DRAFT_551946 [Durotheca rogersii]|uniref:uncharacterized protein n=1 Tax=Durotheca rogersii TaxID=419775 RepID=UPI00221E8363|nr:uncharacterized protein GGS23DRAFT_551946 [Durotheca rogersii]KAI5866758.1 hypothetical protein GGS23DRAFT_551946 [Durotheca rogersii]